jgi:two-component system nitrate/nitrite response regulator NarL
MNNCSPADYVVLDDGGCRLSVPDEKTSMIRLMVSDPSQLVREGISRILASDKMSVVSEQRSMVEVLEALREGRVSADLLLADPSADSDRQFEAMSQIRQEFPAVRIVVLTSQFTAPWLERALGAGASGFLPKDMSSDALKFSLELVLLGEQIFPTVRSVLETDANRSTTTPGQPGQPRPPTAIPLSRREKQILQCLVDGFPNKTIARNLDMAEATVKVHLKSILRKLNVQNRTQAAIWGMNNPIQMDDDPGSSGGTTLSHSKVRHG